MTVQISCRQFPPDPSTTPAQFEQIYLDQVRATPFFPIEVLHRIPGTSMVRRYAPHQITEVLAQFELRRSRAALELQMAKILAELKSRHGAAPAPRPHHSDIVEDASRAISRKRVHTRLADLDEPPAPKPRPRVRRFKHTYRPVINWNEGRGIRRWG